MREALHIIEPRSLGPLLNVVRCVLRHRSHPEGNDYAKYPRSGCHRHSHCARAQVYGRPLDLNRRCHSRFMGINHRTGLRHITRGNESRVGLLDWQAGGSMSACYPSRTFTAIAERNKGRKFAVLQAPIRETLRARLIRCPTALSLFACPSSAATSISSDHQVPGDNVERRTNSRNSRPPKSTQSPNSKL